MSARHGTTRRPWLFAGLLLVSTCAARADEASLKDSFSAQIASVFGVEGFERSGDELTFAGPDGRGGTGAWVVQIESVAIEPGNSEQQPYEGHVTSTWSFDGAPIDAAVGSMSFLPPVFLETGVAEVCYALWEAEASHWGW
ncbi:MAG: hypothetical protein CL482_16915 [Acidobacteria bacterium]|nr:hypothetical protein [Acidobacteriota bacterium]